MYLTHLTELSSAHANMNPVPIPTLLNNLKIPHQQATGSKHHNTKLQTNRRSGPGLSMRITAQRRLPRKRILCPSSKSGNSIINARFEKRGGTSTLRHSRCVPILRDREYSAISRLRYSEAWVSEQGHLLHTTLAKNSP